MPKKKRQTYFQRKDAIQFAVCTHIITRGNEGSDSYLYMSTPPNLGLVVNSLHYTSADVVGVHAENKRKNRVSFSKALVSSAVEAGSVLITATRIEARRAVNVGQREIRAYLEQCGYEVTEYKDRAVWRKPTA